MTPPVALVYQPTRTAISPGLRAGDTILVPPERVDALLASGAFRHPTPEPTPEATLEATLEPEPEPSVPGAFVARPGLRGRHTPTPTVDASSEAGDANQERDA